MEKGGVTWLLEGTLRPPKGLLRISHGATTCMGLPAAPLVSSLLPLLPCAFPFGRHLSGNDDNDDNDDDDDDDDNHSDCCIGDNDKEVELADVIAVDDEFDKMDYEALLPAVFSEEPRAWHWLG
mmetsp:Transcript_71740/g.126318  ORF Transcript_71740/g.126318 Transcript_71740/m.126318 type:complete len:124 (-) Transcript_71740:380-751(-)